jgi:hypothetical protein
MRPDPHPPATIGVHDFFPDIGRLLATVEGEMAADLLPGGNFRHG